MRRAAELGRDIRKNGLRFSIALWQPDKGASALLLDGISRLDALQLVMGGPVCVVYEPMHKRSSEMMWSIKAGEDWIADEKVIVLDSSIDPTTYVISVNAHRRHLKPEQKREVITNLIKLQPEKSDRQIAETVKASPTTVGTVRAEMESDCPDWTVAEACRQGRQKP